MGCDWLEILERHKSVCLGIDGDLLRGPKPHELQTNKLQIDYEYELPLLNHRGGEKATVPTYSYRLNFSNDRQRRFARPEDH